MFFLENKSVRILNGSILLFAFAHLAGLGLSEIFWQIERLFHLGREGNVPTWFSSLLLFFVAATGFSCSQESDSRQEKSIWLAFAAGFMLLSCDEVSLMHENLSLAIESRLNDNEWLFRLTATKWPIFFAPIAIAILYIFWRSMRPFFEKCRPAKLWILNGFFLFFGAAMGIELLENLWTRNEFRHWSPVATFLEETLEMLGVIVILQGTLLSRRFLQQKKLAFLGHNTTTTEVLNDSMFNQEVKSCRV